METPGENTEIIRMLRDFKDAIYKSGPPIQFDSPHLVRGFQSGRPQANLDASNVASKLDFSNLDETAKYVSTNVRDASKHTPEKLKRRLVSAEVELQASKAALREKETVITMMEPANKKARLSLEQKLEQRKKQNETDHEKITELQIQLKYAQNEASFAKKRVLDCEREKRVEHNRLDLKILSLQEECSGLKLKLSEVESEKAETCGKLNNDICHLQLKVTDLMDENNSSKTVTATLRRQISELTEKAALSTSLQEQLSAAQIQIISLENKIAADEDSALLVKSMQSELKMLPELHKENRMLKDELTKYKESNVSLFQEKMWAFQEKLAQAEKKNLAMVKLQIENEALSNKIAEWESLYDDRSISTVKSPSGFSRRLSNYQKNEMLLTSKLANLTTHCESLEKQNRGLEATIEQLKKSCDQAKQSTSGYEPLIRRQQRRIYLLSKERDNCRKLIDSYVGETTLGAVGMNAVHIETLENTISEYKKSMEKADKEIENLEAQVKVFAEAKESRSKDETLLKQLQEDKEELMNAVQQLKEAKSALEGRLERMSNKSSSKSEKIIHLKCNPLDSAVQQKVTDLKALQDENDRLRKRVKVLEEEGAGVCDVTAKVEEKLETEGSDTQLKSLKEQLATAEKHNKLLLETARSTARDFRQAVYTLMGYKVDAPSTGKYKLSHVYAESQDDYLIFEINDDGVHLLETPFSSQLAGLIDTYLQTYDSVPAFLASVTMDLFKQQTYMLP